MATRSLLRHRTRLRPADEPSEMPVSTFKFVLLVGALHEMPLRTVADRRGTNSSANGVLAEVRVLLHDKRNGKYIRLYNAMGT